MAFRDDLVRRAYLETVETQAAGRGCGFSAARLRDLGSAGLGSG
jgi:hypothetical protein